MGVTPWIDAVLWQYSWAGKAVRGFFGVTIAGLRVGGGLVMIMCGLAMMMKTTVDDLPYSGTPLT